LTTATPIQPKNGAVASTPTTSRVIAAAPARTTGRVMPCPSRYVENSAYSPLPRAAGISTRTPTQAGANASPKISGIRNQAVAAASTVPRAVTAISSRAARPSLDRVCRPSGSAALWASIIRPATMPSRATMWAHWSAVE